MIGIVVPIAEDVIARLGETESLQLAQRLAERKVGGIPVRLTSDTVQQIPATDPDTGAVLPPIRLYRFQV